MIKNKKCIFFFILGFIVTGVTIVLADYAYESNNVYYENNNSTLNSQDVQSALEELDNKCEAKIAASQECPEGYLCTEIVPICKRASTLHTEICNQSSRFCANDGYSYGSEVTYGNFGIQRQTPVSGDAFDCDVNGDGVYDPTNERFYYVSTYFDTSTQTFDNDYYVFIYYSNMQSGTASKSSIGWNVGGNSTSNGPITALSYLPSITGTGAWRDDLLKTRTRNILMGSNGTSLGNIAKSNFSYEGRAARFLTAQELQVGCNITIGNFNDGELSTKCKYLMEQTKYTDSSYSTTYGLWLETASSSTNAWNVNSQAQIVANTNTSNGQYGSRPAIEVPKSKVKY